MRRRFPRFLRATLRRASQVAVLVVPTVLALAVTQDARAGGWDTPMLYSARHMGMGGTAVSYVRDPSAMFHNPAGLAHTRRLSLLGDFSLLLGTIQGSPDRAPPSIESNTTVAPFFLVGAAFRPLSFLTAGIAVYPVASAGATYEYRREGSDTLIEDTTRILFVEISPGIALQLPMYPQLSIGFGWRVTLVSLDRDRAPADGSSEDLLLALSGSNLAGFRVGLQWQPIPQLEVGIAYRHKTVTELDSETGRALMGIEIMNPRTELTLPSRLVLGVRGNLGPVSAAADVEIGFNSQNDRAPITVDLGPDMPLDIPNVFEWSTALTLRLGVEYRIGLGGVVLDPDRTPSRAITAVPGEATDATATTGRRVVVTPRLGFVYDARTSNPGYPSAFGTPPAPTLVFTGGVGLDLGGFEANLAFAHRFGSVTISDQDVAESDPCPFCGRPGDYEIGLSGIYVDVGYDFE
ncbi:MAG: hypothetical protein IT379_08345 [Deltaproteobacteria bacterium]|nr:hypothetical protein [Deltaproteobacteria bacterium]